VVAARLWARIIAAWRPEMMTFSSLRGSAMIAVPLAARGTSSKRPLDSIRRLIRSGS
jgi:hypothetical protein